jgi:ATP-dependent protease ClpP protease subunit
MKPGRPEAKILVQKGQRVAVMSHSGTIGPPSGLSASQFIESLTSLGKHDVLYTILDSSGGSPVDAWAIFSFLKRTSHTRNGSLVLITGECAGDALLVALGFDQILMRADACIAFRPAEVRSLATIRLTTKIMARVTAKRAGCQVEDVLAWIDKDRRFTAEECLRRSLCDAIV